jgi:hypothetical protein
MQFRHCHEFCSTCRAVDLVASPWLRLLGWTFHFPLLRPSCRNHSLLTDRCLDSGVGFLAAETSKQNRQAVLGLGENTNVM